MDEIFNGSYNSKPGFIQETDKKGGYDFSFVSWEIKINRRCAEEKSDLFYSIKCDRLSKFRIK